MEYLLIEIIPWLVPNSELLLAEFASSFLLTSQRGSACNRLRYSSCMSSLFLKQRSPYSALGLLSKCYARRVQLSIVILFVIACFRSLRQSN